MRLKTPAVLCLCGTLVTAMTTPLATPINLPLGSNMGYGGASSHHTVFSTMNNPAVAATWEAKEPWRLVRAQALVPGSKWGLLTFNHSRMPPPTLAIAWKLFRKLPPVLTYLLLPRNSNY